jgi:hypothetical protein
MSFMISKRKSLVLAQAIALAGISASAVAAQGRDAYTQGREIFTWTGTVDREVEITMRNRSISVRGVNGGEDRGRAQVLSAIPRDEGRVDVRVQDGRGDVNVIQQPSARNDYTTIVRIRDRSSGADRYRVFASWQSDDRYDRGNPGRANGRIGDVHAGKAFGQCRLPFGFFDITSSVTTAREPRPRRGQRPQGGYSIVSGQGRRHRYGQRGEP